MGGLIPLSDASRRPVRMPVVTPILIVVNVFVFLLGSGVVYRSQHVSANEFLPFRIPRQRVRSIYVDHP